MDRAQISIALPVRWDYDSLPHICFVALHAWPVLSGSREITFAGGAEVQQCLIARGLAARGYAVSMLCLDYGQPEVVEVDGVRVYRLYRPNAGLPILRFLYPRLSSLWSGMRTVDADIYYQRGSDMHTGVVAAFSRCHRKKSIFAGASNIDFFLDQPWIRYGRDKWLFKYGLQRVGAIVAQNTLQQQLCRQNHGRDAMLIRSCCPITSAKADPHGGMLWVGTIKPIKSPERLIELARKLPECRFTMIGGPGGSDTESRRYYDSIRSQAVLLPNLTFVGFVHPVDVEPYFDRARLFINTSDTEGFPNTFLQAWSRGIPTLSIFDTGSLEDEQSVCATAPNLNGLVELARTLSRDDVLWQAFGERCLQHYLRLHSLPIVLDTYEHLFQTLYDSSR